MLNRVTAFRLVAALLLVLQGGANGVHTALHEIATARARASVAHIEGGSGLGWASRDHATCPLCEVMGDAALRAARPVSVAALPTDAPSVRCVPALPSSGAPTALHSRAPPVPNEFLRAGA
jgi:hypothetical protein